MRERGPRGKAIGGKGVLAGKQMLGSLGFDIFSSPGDIGQDYENGSMTSMYCHDIDCVPCLNLMFSLLSFNFSYQNRTVHIYEENTGHAGVKKTEGKFRD